MASVTPQARLPREIAPGIHWLGSCLGRVINGVELHGHSSAYLILGTERTLLVDTGRPQSWAEISQILDERLAGRPLDFCFPTHPELPHSGNLGRVVAKYPEIKVVGDVRDYHLFYPNTEPHLVPMQTGDEIDLGGGYRFISIEAVIRDLPNTQWGYESSQEVMFCADGFAFMHAADGADEDPTHLPGECGMLTSEIDGPVNLDYASFFTGSAIYWTRFIDNAEDLFGRFEDLLREYPTNLLAPGHGNVVDRVQQTTAVMKEAHEKAYRQFSPAKTAR